MPFQILPDPDDGNGKETTQKDLFEPAEPREQTDQQYYQERVEQVHGQQMSHRSLQKAETFAHVLHGKRDDVDLIIKNQRHILVESEIGSQKSRAGEQKVYGPPFDEETQGKKRQRNIFEVSAIDPVIIGSVHGDRGQTDEIQSRFRGDGENAESAEGNDVRRMFRQGRSDFLKNAPSI